MWRSCWGALLLAGLLCLFWGGQGVGALESDSLQYKGQQVGLGWQAMSKALVKQALDARAGFACDVCIRSDAATARDEPTDDASKRSTSRPSCRHTSMQGSGC